MNIAQLEADLKSKQAAAKTLLEQTMHACEEHIVTPATDKTPAVKGRLMTTEEKAAIQALLDEAKGIKARLDGVTTDANMMAEIDRLTSNLPDRNTVAGQRKMLSIGQQFVSNPEYRKFIERQGHRSSSAWNAPATEAVVQFQATTLTEDPASGGKLILPDVQPGILFLLFKRLVIADLAAPGTTTSNMIQFMKETLFTNNAAAVLEGGTKPESALAFDSATSPVQKLAHWIPVTEEMLEDFAQTQSIIDARLRLGLALTEEDQLLNGNGTPPNLRGYMNLAGLAAPIARGTDTNMDAIFKQITAISTTSFVTPDAWVMNPTNWQTCQLSKDAQGQYVGGGPFTTAQTPTMWGLPGAITPSIVAGTSLVGGFRSSSQIFRRGGVRVEASNSHQDFFIKNLVAIRAEERLALVVYREAAFGKVTGLN